MEVLVKEDSRNADEMGEGGLEQRSSELDEDESKPDGTAGTVSYRGFLDKGSSFSTVFLLKLFVSDGVLIGESSAGIS